MVHRLSEGKLQVYQIYNATKRDQKVRPEQVLSNVANLKDGSLLEIIDPDVEHQLTQVMLERDHVRIFEVALVEAQTLHLLSGDDRAVGPGVYQEEHRLPVQLDVDVREKIDDDHV